MARQTKSKDINGYTYKVTQLGALVGRKALARLAQATGPAIGTYASTQGDNETKSNAALARLLGALSESETEYFCDLFAPTTTVSGKEFRGDAALDINFDDHFAGNYDALIKWLVFSLEVNFGGFFDEARRKLAAQAKAAEEESA